MERSLGLMVSVKIPAPPLGQPTPSVKQIIVMSVLLASVD